MKILLVAIGSALGGVLRYLVPCLFAAHKGFPWATLTVNVVGSLLIGLLSGLLARHGGASAESIRAFAVVGFCGGFTTFSSFSMETMTLLRGSSYFYAAANVALNLLCGFCAVWAGLMLARTLVR